MQRTKTVGKRNELPRSAKQDKAYKNPDKDPRGPWKATPLQARNYYSKGLYKIHSPSGRVIEGPPKGTYWRVSEKNFLILQDEKRIWWGQKGNNIPAQKRFLSEVQGGVVPSTIWSYDEVGHNAEAKTEVRTLFSDIEDIDMFITPKPERLIERILVLATKEGDIVLDSFLGSGTTAAVAHKINRHWIGIELGEHCHTHCLPRLKKVVDGTDQGGISKTIHTPGPSQEGTTPTPNPSQEENIKKETSPEGNKKVPSSEGKQGWVGGGGFKYYYLAPSLLKKDKYDNWVIDERYNADMLAAAMAKHEGFKYSPDEQIYWKQGQSTEKDFIFTTTRMITVAFLDKIHEDMRDDESLLICCKSYQKACENKYPNITVRKIPHMLLGRCEFGKDDYSLNIINMPHAEDEPDFVPVGPEEEKLSVTSSKKKKKTRANGKTAQMNLFPEKETTRNSFISEEARYACK